MRELLREQDPLRLGEVVPKKSKLKTFLKDQASQEPTPVCPDSYLSHATLAMIQMDPGKMGTTIRSLAQAPSPHGVRQCFQYSAQDKHGCDLSSFDLFPVINVYSLA